MMFRKLCESYLVFALLMVSNLNKISCVVCKYHPYSLNYLSHNVTCSGVCCTTSSVIRNAEDACCSALTWETTGIYIGLCIPLFCCVASLVAGVSYCFAFKPSRYLTRRRCYPTSSTQDLRVVNSSPDLEPSLDYFNKDKPPTYSELFKSNPRASQKVTSSSCEPVSLTIENLDTSLPITSNRMIFNMTTSTPSVNRTTTPSSTICVNSVNGNSYKTRSFVKDRINIDLTSPPPAYQVSRMTEISE